MSSAIFATYRSALLSQPLSAVWRGHGSAIFLEFGRLTPQVRHDGTAGNPQGAYTVMIEWSWRIEDEGSILCGSWSDEENWGDAFTALIGREVRDVTIFGRLPELSIALAGGFYVTSFMTADDQPAWTIFDNSIERPEPRYICVREGMVCEDTEA